MDNELLKEKLEGEQTDTLGITSIPDGSGVQLNNSPVPTQEEIDDANSLSVDNDGSNDGIIQEQESDTPVEIESVNETVAESVEEPQTAEKLFTQSQVNDLVGKTRMETREQTYRAIYGRYGVDDEAGMDELIGNAQRYDTVRDEYDSARKNWENTDLMRNNELAEVKEHVALLESGIDRSRFDDAKAIIKAKGLEVNVENIENELATHPEWKGKTAGEEINPNFHKSPTAEPQVTPTPTSTIKVLGNEGSSDSNHGMSEEEYAMKKLFKLQKGEKYMDRTEMESLVKQLKASGLTEEQIMETFFETFQEGKMDRKDLEACAEFMGYELTDDFKNDPTPDPIAAGDGTSGITEE